MFIRLRNLTEIRYPPSTPGIIYSLFDMIKNEYFHYGLPEKDEKLLKEQLNKSQVLWLLDGYDEIIQNIPSHLQYLLEQLLKTQHHILTSRPYLNTLSYEVQLEITGFTDDNIEEYVNQFFDQIKDNIDNALLEAPKLLRFLKSNPRVWGIVHIPVNLELMCSLWCDIDWLETTTVSITTVYDKMIEWLFRRYLEKQNICSNQMIEKDVYAYCYKELSFLESLAFNGMKNQSIILPPKLLRIASKECGYSLQCQPHLLNIGILKSLEYKPIGTRIEADKNHYFVHLSFQEHLAARYLVKAFTSSEDQKRQAINFVQAHKYNQRFELLFIFASGLFNKSDDEQSINLFWSTLLGEPRDLIGVRHTQLLISCLEETDWNKTLPHYRESMDTIIKWIKYLVTKNRHYQYDPLIVSLRRSSLIVNQSEIIDLLIQLHKHEDPIIKNSAYWLISNLPITNPRIDLVRLHLTALNDDDMEVRRNACEALGNMGEKAATTEIINKLFNAIGDTNNLVRSNAFGALVRIGEKAATNEVVNGLVNALGNTNDDVRSTACKALGKIGEKATTDEVVFSLVSELRDTDDDVRSNACETLGKIGEKAATNKVIDCLISALNDEDGLVRSSACETLGKIGEKAATNKVIDCLISALSDKFGLVRRSACETLGKIGGKTATNDVIDRLVSALSDTDVLVRRSSCEALGDIGEKAATNEIINRLISALGDRDDGVRHRACATLSEIGEEATTSKVTGKLISALEDADYRIRSSACEALVKIGEKATTYEVITKLVNALNDINNDVRRSASQALGKMRGKAATTEVIHRLIRTLNDTDGLVRRSVCKALGKIGENSATEKVIDGLVIALRDTDGLVRRSVCKALGKIGKEAATNEIINRLVSAMNDRDDEVRHSACEALGKMGEKAATNDVIHILLNAVADTNDLVRSNACIALGRMGEKAASNEVIKALLDACYDDKLRILNEVTRSIQNVLDSTPTMSYLKYDTVDKLEKFMRKSERCFMLNISPEKSMSAFLNTKILLWLPIISMISVRRGYGIVLTTDAVTIYSNREPVELPVSNRELGQQLQNYFLNWLDKNSFESVNELCRVIQ